MNNLKLKIQKYPSYKDSGIDWLGKVPEHWTIKRMKDIGSIKYGLGQPPNYLEEGLPFIRATNIERGKIVDKGLVFINPKEIPSERKIELKKNDIIVVRSGAYTADSAIISEKYRGAVAGFDMVLRPKKIIPKYLSYALLSKYVLNDQLILLSYRAAQPHLNKEELNITILFYPPLSEQAAIADYLDLQTSHIDRKIELLSKKAESYKSLKQSLINETVTRGLNQSVAMKDSGIEWLGEVPEHWEVKRVKDIFIESKNKVGLESSKYKVLSLTMKGVIIRDLENNKGKMPASFDGYQIVKKNNLIFCLFDMDVTPMIVGIAEQEGIITSAYTIIKYNPRISMNYFYYYFLAQNYNKSLLAKSKTLRSTLTFDTFSLVSLPLPPLPEQAAIADYLDKKTSQVGKIVETIHLQIEKLKELRKTLINDVVTGKVRVADNG